MAAVTDSAVVSLNGKVTDVTAAPVAGAIVTLSNNQGVLTSTETNEYGAYSFPSLKPGSYSVRVNSPGFAMFENRSVTVSAGRPRLLNVRLAGQLTVSTVELAKNPAR
jgi:protocatechuate 3,4-dioxygenase beta subunit